MQGKGSWRPGAGELHGGPAGAADRERPPTAALDDSSSLTPPLTGRASLTSAQARIVSWRPVGGRQPSAAQLRDRDSRDFSNILFLLFLPVDRSSAPISPVEFHQRRRGAARSTAAPYDRTNSESLKSELPRLTVTRIARNNGVSCHQRGQRQALLSSVERAITLLVLVLGPGSGWLVSYQQ
ncbi:hypothetical protein PAHAL_2G422500 [Panicum hallii]|uniref:Uncharacterized protein n=1 Tax=Panicum hallii TaxID=206008 RepID=A0A2T8KSE9_9POAL|nr:hypothetical protein PAHAL_2G422500 [Panicum hallii]